MVMGNIVYQKFVVLTIGPWAFTVSAGALVYPMTFVVTDWIAECYGKEAAKSCVRSGIAVGLIAASIIIFTNYGLDAAPWSKISNHDFDRMFNHYGFAILASLFAGLVSQSFDVLMYLWFKQQTQARWLGARNIICSSISLLLDTIVVLTLLCFFEIIPWDQYAPLIRNTYGIKLVIVILNVPVFYLGVYGIRRLQLK
jgi:uncharacterized integral membrane protein (TIGR00697 family)